MNKEQMNTLAQIYNALCMIETKGQSTVLMANCLGALKKLFDEENQGDAA